MALSKAIGSGSAVASGQVDYYPFGMEQSRSTATSGGPLYSSDTPPYLYSGNEQEKLNGLNQYDFHARWLDNAVARFTTQDPLAEAHYDESPYVYCGNDPVNRIDPLGLDWYYNDENEFPTYIPGSEDNKKYKRHAKTRVLESDHYKYYFGEYGSIYIVEKMTGDAMTYLPETVVKPGGGGYTNYNSYSYASLDAMMGDGGDDKTGLALSMTDFVIGDYDSFVHNHETYRTKAGEIKNIYKPNGLVRSARAAKFAAVSKLVSGASLLASAVSTGYSINKVYEEYKSGGLGNVNSWDAADAVVGSAGTISSAIVMVGLVSNPVGIAVLGTIGTAAFIYGGVRLGMDIYENW